MLLQARANVLTRPSVARRVVPVHAALSGSSVKSAVFGQGPTAGFVSKVRMAQTKSRRATTVKAIAADASGASGGLCLVYCALASARYLHLTLPTS